MLRGLPPITVGGETRAVSLPIGDDAHRTAARHRCRRSRSSASSSALVFLAVFTWFFLKSRMGIAMRAVADNQQVAMAMGINVRALFRAGLGDGGHRCRRWAA